MLLATTNLKYTLNLQIEIVTNKTPEFKASNKTPEFEASKNQQESKMVSWF
jgi:hypothetical protein